MPSQTSPPGRRPRFCRHCGAELPAGDPRFCVECGKPVAGVSPAAAPPPPPAPPAPPAHTRPKATVRLPNASVEQAVIGGTVQLPTSGALPPGLWLLDQPPGPTDVVAVYAPLRAIVGGWSGLEGKGWQKVGESPDPHTPRQTLFRFTAVREWFPAPGCGGGLRLKTTMAAESSAPLGSSRRGFRYLTHYDAPMQIVDAHWVDVNGLVVQRDLPQIQIMAPPRIPRVSDYEGEEIRTVTRSEAEQWARQGALYQEWRLLNVNQQHTPVGRGLVHAEWKRPFLPLFGQPWARLFFINAERPFRCKFADWRREQRRIATDARSLGLDLGTELVVEWWLDRQGYDAVIFDGAQSRYGYNRVAIAFRRAQIVAVGG